jgi:hypothetical protein
MLSTIDNPFDPFTQWDDWYAFDTQAGYNSSGLLARTAVTSHELTEAQMDQTLEDAIDYIVQENVLGVSIKVCKEE